MMATMVSVSARNAIKPVLKSSVILGSAMFVGDVAGQYISHKQLHIDFKRSAIIGCTGFFLTNPMSFSVGRLSEYLVRNLSTSVPILGRFPNLSRVVVSCCTSPVVSTVTLFPSFLYQTEGDVKKTKKLVSENIFQNWMLYCVCMGPMLYYQHRFVPVVAKPKVKNVTTVAWNSVLNCKKYIAMDPEIAIHAVSHHSDLFA